MNFRRRPTLNLTDADHTTIFDVMIATEATAQVDPVTNQWKLWPRAGYLSSKFCRNLRYIQFLLHTGKDDLLRSIFFAPIDVRHLFQRPRYKSKHPQCNNTDGSSQTEPQLYKDEMCQTETHPRESSSQTDNSSFKDISCQTSVDLLHSQCLRNTGNLYKAVTDNVIDEDVTALSAVKEINAPAMRMIVEGDAAAVHTANKIEEETLLTMNENDDAAMQVVNKHEEKLMVKEDDVINNDDHKDTPLQRAKAYVTASKFRNGKIQSDVNNGSPVILPRNDGNDKPILGEEGCDYGGGGDGQCQYEDTEITLDKVTAYLTKHTPSSDRCPDLMSLSPVSSRSDSSVSIELPKLEVSSSPRRNVREYPQSGIDTSLEFYRFVQERLALEDRSAKYATRNIGKTQLFVYIFICLLGFVLFLDIYP